MTKSKNIGREDILRKARQYAGSQSKGKGIAFNGFMKGVEYLLDELDGKTIVMDRDSNSGDFVNAGTITGSFSWAMRNVEYEREHKNCEEG